jgi:predicted SprT family Zn-dependent metalloprotease
MLSQRIGDILKQLTKDHPRYDIGTIRFETSGRMTRCAGLAFPSKRLIKLSTPYFSNPDNLSELRETVIHEVAHVLADSRSSQKKGRREIHGPEWRKVAQSLGGRGDRCHRMELSKDHQRPLLEGICSRCQQQMALGPIQHKKYHEGATYSHRKCPPLPGANQRAINKKDWLEEEILDDSPPKVANTSRPEWLEEIIDS